MMVTLKRAPRGQRRGQPASTQSLDDVVQDTVRPWRKHHLDYDQTKYVVERVRRWLALEPPHTLLRLATGRNAQPSAAILDSRTLPSSPESGHRAGYDGAKRRRGSKVHRAVATLGHLLALHVTPANAQERAPVAQLIAQVQDVPGDAVAVAFVDQGYTGERPAQEAAAHGLQLEVVNLPEAEKGFVLPPRRRVVERSFGWAARFRRLARGYERFPETLAGLHCLAFTLLLLKRFVALLVQSA